MHVIILYDWMYALYMLNQYFRELAHWNNSPQVDMSHYSRHIILIPSQPVFALTPECCMHSRETANTYFIIFDLTQPTNTQGKHTNHYTTDVFRLTVSKTLY
jgi:hypothetical protein